MASKTEVSKTQTRHAWSAVMSCCVMFVIWTGVCWNTATLYADPIIGDWGIQRAEFMVTVTLISLGNALMSLLAYGTLVEKLGIRRLILAGGGLSIVAMAVFALAQNTMMLYVAGFLLGVGLSPLNINTANVVVGSWFKKRTATLVGVVQTCGSVSGIVFATVMSLAIANLGWRLSYWVTFAAVVVGTIVCYALYKGDPAELGETPMYVDEAQAEGPAAARAGETGATFKEMFRTPRFYLLTIGYLLVGVVGYSILGSLALMSVDFGYGSLAGTVLSTALFASAIAMTVVGMLTDKLGSSWAVAVCFACIIGSMLILHAEAVSLPMLYVAAALAGVAYDAALMPVGASVHEAFGEVEYGKKLGFIAAFDYIGISFGATILSVFYDMEGSYDTGLLVFVGLAVAAMALVFIGTRRGAKK